MTPFSQWLTLPRPHVMPIATESGQRDEQEDVLNEVLHLLSANVHAEEQARLSSWFSELKAECTKTEAARNHKQLHSDVSDMQNYIACTLAHILVPLLEVHVVERGVNEFCALLKRHISIRPDEQPRLFAPSALKSTLERGLQRGSMDAEIVDSPELELRARIGSTEFETDMVKWIDRLRGTDISDRK
jgi:hypothetical protein